MLRTGDQARALMAHERKLGVKLLDEGDVRATFGDGIIADTTAEKTQGAEEVSAGLMIGWENRARWYGEDEEVTRDHAGRYHTSNGPILR